MKTALITGANVGIGLATAKALAQRGYHLILVCRNAQKGQAAQTEIQRANPAVPVELLTADLTNLDSVRAVAQQVSQQYDRLDVLINNAGYMPTSIEFVGPVEKSFFANHVGHFVLTHHLLDLLQKTARQTNDVRVITLSSSAYLGGRKERFFRRIEDLNTLIAYCDGKLANLLFSKELATRLTGTGITAYSVHPGAVKTNFGSDLPGVAQVILGVMRPFMRTPERGAETSVFLASGPLKSIGERNNGGFFADSRPQTPRNRDITPENARWLWEKTMAFV